jgi:hypothetical protein
MKARKLEILKEASSILSDNRDKIAHEAKLLESFHLSILRGISMLGADEVLVQGTHFSEDCIVKTDQIVSNNTQILKSPKLFEAFEKVSLLFKKLEA